MNNNRKTHTYIWTNLQNQLSILTKKRIQFWLQNTLRKLPSQPQFQFCKSQIYVEIIYNFYYIQKIIMPLCQKNKKQAKQGIYVYLPTQTSIIHVEQEKKVDKAFMLACQLRPIFSLSFNFFYSKSKIHTDIYGFFLFACLSILTLFTKWPLLLNCSPKSIQSPPLQLN